VVVPGTSTYYRTTTIVVAEVVSFGAILVPVVIISHRACAHWRRFYSYVGSSTTQGWNMIGTYSPPPSSSWRRMSEKVQHNILSIIPQYFIIITGIYSTVLW